jgi:hypothetical protein
MREHFPPVTINFAHVRIIGIPGLSLVAIAVAIAFEFPVGRALLFSGIAGGLLVAAALILARRPREQASREPPRGPLSTRVTWRPRPHEWKNDGRLMACDLPSIRQGA